MNLSSDDSSTSQSTSTPQPPLPAMRRPPPRFELNMSEARISRYIAEYREWADEESRIAPLPPPRLDRNVLIKQQMDRCSALHAEMRVQVFTSILGATKYSSKASVKDLKPSAYPY